MKTIVYGSSIKGNGHFMKGTECQDSNSFSEKDFSDDAIKVIALADGHGGSPYARSSRGSAFAVDITKKALYDFVFRMKDHLDEIDSLQSLIDSPPLLRSHIAGDKKDKKNAEGCSWADIASRCKALADKSAEDERGTSPDKTPKEAEELCSDKKPARVTESGSDTDSEIEIELCPSMTSAGETELCLDGTSEIETGIFRSDDSEIEIELCFDSDSGKDSRISDKTLESAPVESDGMKVLDVCAKTFECSPAEDSKNDSEGDFSLSERKAALENIINEELEAVKGSIIKSWNAAVDAALAANPVTAVQAEMLRFSTVDNSPTEEKFLGYADVEAGAVNFVNRDLNTAYLESVDANPRQLYGATLLAVAQYNTHLFILQVGDGDVTVIDSNGNVENPIKKNEYLRGNETDSLCQRTVMAKFKSTYVRRKIKIAMLSTDGIANALEDERGLETVARGIYDSLNEEPAEFRNEYKPFLRRFSGASMDDCTVCFIANGIKDESYEIIKASAETEEKNTLDSTYRPMFEDYKLNRELYSVIESKDRKNRSLHKLGLQKIGETAIKTSFMKERYIEFIESVKQVDKLPRSTRLILEIISLGKNYLEDQMKRMNAEQEEAYRLAVNELLSKNQLRLIKFKQLPIGRGGEGKPTEDTDIRTAVVLGMSRSRIEFAEIHPDVYSSVRDIFGLLVGFEGNVSLPGGFRVNVNNYHFTLIKEN